MPVYCYREPRSGKVHEVVMTVSEMLRREKGGKLTLDDGTKVERCYEVEHGGFRNTPGNWPMKSDALGCHPDQVKEFEQHCASLGVPTRYTSDGRAVLENREHRRRLLRAMGYHDRDGGYSD